MLCSRVQDGGAITTWGSNNRADLTSCTLSGNEAIEVRRHAAQEQFTKHLCMLRLVLLLGCWRICMQEECGTRGMAMLGVSFLERRRHRNQGQQQQHGGSWIMHAERQSS